MKNKNYIALLGAVLGGLVASIPWILMYLFGNMILSPLATLIAAGAIFGYKLFKGEYFKQLPIFISVISVIIVTLDNLVVISLIFTILGISGVIKNLKNQVTTEEN